MPKPPNDNPVICATCGTAIRIGQKDCVNCLLREGLETKGETSRADFERVLEGANVPDQSWRLGHYEILEEIGRGGMGVIYRARQRPSQRIVALKRVLAEQADSPETLARFRREAEAVASLDHPHILPIYEVSESESGLPFFSMKYATGGSLREVAPALLSRPNECVRLMAKVARAIAYAHDEGILHRDLQPGNILLDAKGEPLVSDFGLAKWLTEDSDLTQTLTTFGTPGYIAPEQAENAASELTPAADIYSLGAILFNLLAHRPPFVGANVLSVLHQAAANPAPKLRSLAPSLDRDLETITARCLEREPQARYQSAADLAEDLERWLEGRPILARPIHAPARVWRWARRNPILAGAAGACLLLAAMVVWLLRGPIITPQELAPPDKSIAVLPFQNLSADKENSYFAAGIEDDVLTSLSQIHELRVISRTSAMAYAKADGRNIREIGRALGVANVLEGSVRRAGNRVLVNVQLIDARNDQHLWSERYDRSLADSLGLQGELATEIASALRATLAPEEKTRLETEPTKNSAAYELYLKAGERNRTASTKEDGVVADQMYAQAIALDPSFALAIARDSILNSRFYYVGRDPVRKTRAWALAKEALRLAPTLGEAHLAMGICFSRLDNNYEAALQELSTAAAILPNDPEILDFSGAIYRRQGRWREALANFERAQALDPRNPYPDAQDRDIPGTYMALRDWPAAIAALQRGRQLAPGNGPENIDGQLGLAYVEFYRTGNLAAGEGILRKIPAGLDPDGAVTRARWEFKMWERDFAAAEKILAEYPSEEFPPPGRIPKIYYQGLTALARGDAALAKNLFEKAKPHFELRLQNHPDDPRSLAPLGRLYAYLGRKEEAIRLSRRAVELMPQSKDATEAPGYETSLALVYAYSGEAEQAVALLDRLLSIPNGMALAELRVSWDWDPLRSNSRFQKILAGPEPQTILTTALQAAPAVPEKSIAVLPFENLGGKKDNSDFGAGIQDDVLTSLAQIHDLKVISRTSVMAYQKSAGRNMREIGQALGVANVLEGTVRREGNRVLVNVQLIDARNDRHLWAERYDRTVADAIGLQGELATQIAAALKATLAPEEKTRLNAGPTTNSEAYVLYLTALGKEATDEIAAEQLYVQATTNDPKFALAYARASLLNSEIANYEESLARKTKARAQADEALRLSPGLGEAHMALGVCLYLAEKKYNVALHEFEIAAATLPNNAGIYTYVSGIYRRQGRWRDALASFERALSLDPRNAHVAFSAANNELFMRDWPRAIAGFNRVLKIAPDSNAKVALAYLEVFRSGNPVAGRKILQDSPTGMDPDGWVALARWDFAMLERDYATAEKIVTDSPLEDFPRAGDAPKTYYQGRSALARGDIESARRYFAGARLATEKRVRDDPDVAELHARLGLLYAYMQRKEDAIRESRRAVELEPESQNAFHGAHWSANLAMVYALVGEPDQAITLIERLLSTPGPVSWPDWPSSMTLADLRLRREWDSLRSNPRFQKILVGPEPKTVLTASR